MNVLIIGGGGREHALAWKLAQSPRVTKIYCAPGNGGTAALGTNVPLAVGDGPALLAFALAHDIGLTVVGPDDALADGMVDRFQSAGLRIFGPTRAAAQLEWSKVFCKDFLRRHGIPTAAAGSFSDSAAALQFCAGRTYPLVIKADGLAMGKGVIIAQNQAEAAETIHQMLEAGRFGNAGATILIEEFLLGPEISLHAFLDGTRYRLLPLAQDFKRIGEGGAGANTGGMGAVSPPVIPIDAGLEQRIHDEIMKPLMAGLAKDSIDFRGLLFPGLLLTADGPKVLEFNARFGDPETQVLLPRLQTDLLPVLEAVIDGRLDEVSLEWDPRAAVCVIMASRGYPDKYETGFHIQGLDAYPSGQDGAIPATITFQAGTRFDGDRIITAGGRVLGITALADSIEDARSEAYNRVNAISFEGAYTRRDIAAPSRVE